jgi:hypothetical protein
MQSPTFFSTKPDPGPTAPLPAAAEFEFTPELVHSPLGHAHTIKEALEKHRLSCWGFVLFRCTYRSQEKWEMFVALVQGHARDSFERAGLMDVYARMRWTVFEDAAALDGASIGETSRRFIEWVEPGPGAQELVGSVFAPIRAQASAPTRAQASTPRHNFYLHVDEESLESVVDDVKAREDGGYFATVVSADNVMLQVAEWDGVLCPEAWGLDEEDMDYLRKRFRIDDLVGVYATLQVADFWDILASHNNIFEPY